MLIPVPSVVVSGIGAYVDADKRPAVAGLVVGGAATLFFNVLPFALSVC